MDMAIVCSENMVEQEREDSLRLWVEITDFGRRMRLMLEVEPRTKEGVRCLTFSREEPILVEDGAEFPLLYGGSTEHACANCIVRTIRAWPKESRWSTELLDLLMWLNYMHVDFPPNCTFDSVRLNRFGSPEWAGRERKGIWD